MKWIKSQWLNAISLLAYFDSFFIVIWNLDNHKSIIKKNNVYGEFDGVSHITMGVECLHLSRIVHSHSLNKHTHTEECAIESDPSIHLHGISRKKSLQQEKIN